MKTVTVTMPEEVAHWARKKAAEENISVSKLVGRMPGSSDAALRLMWMALTNHAKKWTFVQGWREALNRFQNLWPERTAALERN